MPSVVNSKPGISTARNTLKVLASFLGKYRSSILATVTLISPGDEAAVAAAIDAIIAASELFERIYNVWRP